MRFPMIGSNFFGTIITNNKKTDAAGGNVPHIANCE
jgi:hypothetical protein